MFQFEILFSTQSINLSAGEISAIKYAAQTPLSCSTTPVYPR